MTITLIALSLVLLPAISFFPGFFIVRGWRLSPGEKLSVAVAVSFVLLYLLGILGLATEGMRPWLKVYAVLAFVLAVVCRRDLHALLGHIVVRRTLKAYLLVAVIGLLALTCIDVNSGGNIWTVDFVEHFERTKALMGELPYDRIFGTRDRFAARPPLMNAAAACYLGMLGGPSFAGYQLSYAFFNLLVFLPTALIGPLLVRRGRPDPWAIAAILFCSPMFFQNTTYAWPKLLTSFFTLLSFALYLRAMRKDDRFRYVLAFLSIASAMLVHYSAGPYVVGLTGHYLVTHAKQWRRYWRSTLLIGATSGLLLATWVVFCVSKVGLSATLAGPTSVTVLYEHVPGDRMQIVKTHFYETTVPYFLRGVEANEQWQTNQSARLREQFFCYYQTNLFGLMGSAGWLLAAAVLLRDRKPSPFLLDPAERTHLQRRRLFWFVLTPGITLLGISVVQPIMDQYGVALTCLIPLSLAALAMVAHGIGRVGLLGKLFLATLAFDFFGGVLLHSYVQSLPLKYVRYSFDGFYFDPPGAFGHLFEHHHAYKGENHIVFFHDFFADFVPECLVGMSLIAAAGIGYLAYRTTVGPPRGIIARNYAAKTR